MSRENTCPVCGTRGLSVEVPYRSILRENELREAFVVQRLGHQPEELEAMDLTRFMHGGPGRILRCRECGLLVRDEADQSHYEADMYDSALMSHLYPRYVRAFEQKRDQYQPLLRNRAAVLEIGSHLGAFLQAGEEWGWSPIGLDIGAATSAFARRQGGTVKRLTLDDYSPKLRRPEAIFIWNCFEQLDDPAAALRKSQELLDRHGLLVVRVPNAEYYRAMHSKNSQAKPLAYNNLLGFPYLHGFTPQSLSRLLRAHRFQPIQTHNSTLLTPPYPDMSRRVNDEWRQVRRTEGPWLEVACIKTETSS